MSGHNKWSQIKRKKEATDKEKSKNFAKVGKDIRLAVKEGGEDPNTNAALRNALVHAREVNMPKSSIERAIERGSGKGETELKRAVYEAYGPGGAAIIIEAETDNKNRTVAEIKHIIDVHGGRMADAGSVMWLFSEKGYMHVSSLQENEKLEEVFILHEVEDYKFENGSYIVYCRPENLSDISRAVEEGGFIVEEMGVKFFPNSNIDLDVSLIKKLTDLVEELYEHEDVDEVFTNSIK